MDPISRRQLLQTLAAGGSALALGPALWLTGCSDEAGSTPPESVWRALQDGVRASPDHLPARARRLVQDRDIEGLIRLVTDDILTLPTGGRGREDAMRSRRWGDRGTLRGGTGTPREKCDLLARLLQEAGTPAQVMSTSRRIPVAWEEWALRPRPSFVPALSEAQVEGWGRSIRSSGAGSAPPPPPDRSGAVESAARALASRVRSAPGLDAARPAPHTFRDEGLPVVVIGEGDAARIVCPAVPGDRLRAPEEGERLTPASTPAPLTSVRVRLDCVATTDPARRIPLVAGEWDANDLVGRQLLIRTVPAVDPRMTHRVTFGGVHAFIPLLAIQGPGMTPEEVEGLVRVGSPFSRSGDPIPVGPSFPGSPAGDDGPSPSLARVVSLEVEADGSAFPVVRGKIRAYDGDNRIVEGLRASDFEILDEERPVPGQVTGNPLSPLVIVLIDTSLSMPPAFRGEGGVLLADELRRRILARFPAARIRLQETDSDLWRWLGWARGQSPDLTVYLTDGDLDRELTPAEEVVLGTSGPTLLLDVSRSARPPGTFGELQRVTGGEVARVEARDGALDRILQRLDALPPPPYLLTFGARGDTPRDRALRVRTADGRVEATTRWEVPDTRIPGDEICGLVATIELRRGGRVRTVEHTLGGYDRSAAGPATAGHVAEAFEALWGKCLIQVEGGGSSPSIRIDDWLESRMALEPLFEAMRTGASLPEVLEAMGDPVVPGELFALTGAFEDPEGAVRVYEEGLHMVAHRSRMRFGSDLLLRSVDILATAEPTGASADARRAFDATLRATAVQAAWEAELFPTSTASVLGDAPLRRVEGSSVLRSEGVDPAGLAGWDHLIRRQAGYGAAFLPSPLPPSGRALWEVSLETGALRGVLADGSGGGSAEQRMERAIRDFDQIMAAYGLLFEGLGAISPAVGGFALGVVAAYSQTLVNLYAAVSITLINMDASNLDDEIRDAMRVLACNVVREAFLGGMGGVAASQVRLFNSINHLLTLFYYDSRARAAMTC